LNKEGYANRTDILNFKDGYKIKDYDLAFELKRK
jgi:hypothetical protein